jgi:ABC-type transporter Mla subunit MlaD
VATTTLESRVTKLERANADTAERIDKLATLVEQNHIKVKDHIAAVVHGSINQLSDELGEFKHDVAQAFAQVDARFAQVDARLDEQGAVLREHTEILNGHGAMLKSFTGMLQAQSEQLREILDRLPQKA